MSIPPINPDKTLAGIALDPRTLERVIPESRRPDGTTRKEIKIRPGFTPQEDVSRFRGSKQSAMDARALPKGHIIGWAPPPSSSKPVAPSGGGGALSKSQKKNQKRKEKREAEVSKKIKDSWEDEDEDEGKKSAGGAGTPGVSSKEASGDANDLAGKLEKLEVH